LVIYLARNCCFLRFLSQICSDLLSSDIFVLRIWYDFVVFCDFCHKFVQIGCFLTFLVKNLLKFCCFLSVFFWSRIWYDFTSFLRFFLSRIFSGVHVFWDQIHVCFVKNLLCFCCVLSETRYLRSACMYACQRAFKLCFEEYRFQSDDICFSFWSFDHNLSYTGKCIQYIS